jgi:hypothetical protein
VNLVERLRALATRAVRWMWPPTSRPSSQPLGEAVQLPDWPYRDRHTPEVPPGLRQASTLLWPKGEWEAIATCPHPQLDGYLTPAQARAAARPGARPRRCPCGLWHLRNPAPTTEPRNR